MKNYDVKPEKPRVGKETLPAGGYVCSILNAKVESNDWGDTLVIAHDVCEGEYKDIFKRDYENNPFENKKWRGVYRCNLPADDGSKYDSKKRRELANLMWSLENSNPGFEWGDWATVEKRLKGKKIGLIYRNKEWAMGDRTGWTTEAAGTDSTDNIREGKFRQLKDKPLANKPVVVEQTFEELDDTSELPF